MSPTIADLPFPLLSLQFLLRIFCSSVWCIQMENCYVFLADWPFYHSVMPLVISLALKFTLSPISIVTAPFLCLKSSWSVIFYWFSTCLYYVSSEYLAGMPAGQVQRPRGGVPQHHPGESLAVHGIEIKCKPARGESGVYWWYRESAVSDRLSGRLRKGESLLFAQGLEFLLRVVVWCSCLLRNPGTS